MVKLAGRFWAGTAREARGGRWSLDAFKKWIKETTGYRGMGVRSKGNLGILGKLIE
jgi:hypothetical protein